MTLMAKIRNGQKVELLISGSEPICRELLGKICNKMLSSGFKLVTLKDGRNGYAVKNPITKNIEIEYWLNV